ETKCANARWVSSLPSPLPSSFAEMFWAPVTTSQAPSRSPIAAFRLTTGAPPWGSRPEAGIDCADGYARTVGPPAGAAPAPGATTAAAAARATMRASDFTNAPSPSTSPVPSAGIPLGPTSCRGVSTRQAQPLAPGEQLLERGQIPVGPLCADDEVGEAVLEV